MGNFTKRRVLSFLARLVLVIMLMTVILPPTPSILAGKGGAVFAAEPWGSLAVQAVRNNYALYQGGKAVDGNWGNFGAYDAYILTQAGADLSTWVHNGTSLKEGVLSLIDDTLAGEGTESRSPAKRVAQEYLAAKTWGDPRGNQLLDILKNRQAATGNGSFDNDAFSDLPALEALARAGDLAEIDAEKALAYIIENQDETTGAWTSAWNDFQTTAQAVRVLESLKPWAGELADAVQTAIDAGMAWLQGRQQADGSFQDEAGFDDPLVDTAEALLTLESLGLELDAWNVEGKSGADYLREKALNEDGSFGASRNLVDNTWALDAFRLLGGSVAPDTVLWLTVTPDTANLQKGETWQYTAQALKMDGTEEDVGGAADWTTGDLAIATVEGGLVTGVGTGETVVTAIYQGVKGTARVIVEDGGDDNGGSNGGGGDPPVPQGVPVMVMVTGRSGEVLFPLTTVYLSPHDTHGLTALGALHKTGLTYSYDSPDYVHTIAGQGPWGMSGWMYMVNGLAPGIPASQYQLQANDQVWWLYSTDPDNLAGLNPGGDNFSLEADKTGDELLEEALEREEEIRINLGNREGNSVGISLAKIRKLSDLNKEFTLNNDGIQLTFAPNSLQTDQILQAAGEEGTALEFSVQPVPTLEKEALLDKVGINRSGGIYDMGGKLFKLTVQITRTNPDGLRETERLEGFGEPVKVVIDLGDVFLTEEEIAQLTAVRYEEEASGEILPVKLGGDYDSVTKQFTFHTDQFSYFGVAKGKRGGIKG